MIRINQISLLITKQQIWYPHQETNTLLNNKKERNIKMYNENKHAGTSKTSKS